VSALRSSTEPSWEDEVAAEAEEDDEAEEPAVSTKPSACIFSLCIRGFGAGKRQGNVDVARGPPDTLLA
jgi:hypothetical protein